MNFTWRSRGLLSKWLLFNGGQPKFLKSVSQFYPLDGRGLEDEMTECEVVALIDLNVELSKMQFLSTLWMKVV